MWIIQGLSVLPTTSTLRSLSWLLLVISFFALLAGLYALRSSVRLLTILGLQRTLNNFPEKAPSLESGLDSSSDSLGSLMGKVTQVAGDITNRKMLLMITVWIAVATLSVWSELKGEGIIEKHQVEVMDVVAPRVYTMFFPARDNPRQLGDQTIVVRLCSYGDDLPLVKGMCIETFQYKQRRECLLIDKDTYDDWCRDKQQNVVDKSGHILFAKEN